MFYWAVNGSPTRNAETIEGTRMTFSPPSLTADGSGTNISAVGPGSELEFYWATDGSSTWTAETVGGCAGLPLP